MITKQVKALLNALGSPHDTEISILITDDLEIADLNQQYRGKQGPTNVISFAMQEGDFSEINSNILGDIVISLDTIKREADEMQITIQKRFTELLVHGILHLFGYDHEKTESQALEMEQKSLELIKILSDNNLII